MAGADGRASVAETAVGFVKEVGYPGHVGAVGLQPAAQQPVDRPLVGEVGQEVEASPQRRVDQRDRTVGGVHRRDDPDVCWQAERRVGVLQPQLLVAVLQQEVQLAEHLGDIAAVELVDYQDVAGLGVVAGSLGHELHGLGGHPG